MSRADNEGRDPEEEEALWDRLVEGRRRTPENRGPGPDKAASAPAPVAPPPDVPVADLLREVAALAASITQLRTEVQALSQRVAEPPAVHPAVAAWLTELRSEVQALGRDQRPAERVTDPAVVESLTYLRNEIEALAIRIESREVQVSLDADQLGHLLKRVMDGMHFDAVLADGQALQLRLRVRPKRPGLPGA